MASASISTDVVLAQDFPELAQRYRAQSVPLTVIESGNAVRTVLGARPEAVFRDALIEADRNAGREADLEGAADG